MELTYIDVQMTGGITKASVGYSSLYRASQFWSRSDEQHVTQDSVVSSVLLTRLRSVCKESPTVETAAAPITCSCQFTKKV